MTEAESLIIIRSTRCACGEPIKRYTLSAIPIPVEETTLYYAKEFLTLGVNIYIPACAIHRSEGLRILLFSECPKCFEVKFWSFPKEVIESLILNEAIKTEGHGINLVYDMQQLDELYNMTSSDVIKADIKNLIDHLKGLRQ